MKWSDILEWARSGNAGLIAAALMLGLAGCSALTRQKSAETYKRGVLLIDGRKSQRRTAHRKKSVADVLTLTGIAIAAVVETKHVKLMCTNGTGQSTAVA